jgi:hypothetical protein
MLVILVEPHIVALMYSIANKQEEQRRNSVQEVNLPWTTFHIDARWSCTLCFILQTCNELCRSSDLVGTCAGGNVEEIAFFIILVFVL